MKWGRWKGNHLKGNKYTHDLPYHWNLTFGWEAKCQKPSVGKVQQKLLSSLTQQLPIQRFTFLMFIQQDTSIISPKPIADSKLILALIIFLNIGREIKVWGSRFNKITKYLGSLKQTWKNFYKSHISTVLNSWNEFFFVIIIFFMKN